jgi:hypothetical protein
MQNVTQGEVRDATEGAERTKKAYRMPELTEIGRLRDLTRGPSLGVPGDGASFSGVSS